MSQSEGRINKVFKFLAIAALISRLVAGGVLATSGYYKLLEPSEDFAASIEAFEFLPGSWTEPFSNIFPWAELIFGSFLFLGYQTRISAGAVAGLFTIFLFIVGSTFFRGIELAHCGCFGGTGPQLTPNQTFVMDSILLLMTITVFFDKERRYSLDRWVEK